MVKYLHSGFVIEFTYRNGSNCAIISRKLKNSNDIVPITSVRLPLGKYGYTAISNLPKFVRDELKNV